MTEEEKKAAAAKAKQEADAERAKALISGAVAEAQAPVLKAVGELTDAVKLLVGAGSKAKATNNMGGVPGATEDRPVILGKAVEAPAGIKAARVLKATLTAKLRGGDSTPDSVLKSWGYEAEAAALVKERALSQSVFADGGALVPAEYSAELIALLRNKTAVRQLGARVFPMGASLEMPSQEAAATASYVGENAAIVASQQALGSLRFTEKKLAALVVVSNDLIRNSAFSAEEFVRDDLVQVLSLKEDYQALFGTGGEYSPRGIVSLTDSGNQYDATAVSQVAPTLAEVKRELAKAKRKLKAANIPMARLGWIISPRTEEYLYAITDGNGNSVFQAALDSGTLHGAPLVVTNQVPESLTWGVDGSTDVSRIFFGDFAQFMIGESMSPAVEVFPNAAYDLSGTVKSGISQDQSVIRAMLKHDFNTRYRKAFVVVGVRWGA